MKFTQSLWEETENIYQKIINHPLIIELASGELDIKKFHYYIQQDELYIKDYSKALSFLAGKAPDSEKMNILLTFAKDGYLIEHELHEHFFKKYDIPRTKIKEPACLSYSCFLLSSILTESYEVGLSSLLPCFWIYREVGLHIFKNSKQNNKYKAWIETYAGDEFRKQVEEMLRLTEDASKNANTDTKEKMMQAFFYSTQLEYRFWDAAYHLKRW